MKWYRNVDTTAEYCLYARDDNRFRRFHNEERTWDEGGEWFDEPGDRFSCLLEVTLLTGTTGPDV